MKGIKYILGTFMILSGGISTGIGQSYKAPKGIGPRPQKMTTGAIQTGRLDSYFDYKFQQKPERDRGISSEESEKDDVKTYVEFNRTPASLELDRGTGIYFFGGNSQMIIGDYIIERIPLAPKEEPQPSYWKYE